MRYCANCGTEVDDTAAFCPTCGQPLDELEAANDESEPTPAAASHRAPAKAADRPEPELAEAADQPDPEPVEAADEPDPEPDPELTRPVDPQRQPQRDAAEWDAPAGASHGPSHASPPPASRSSPHIDLPITWPVTLSAWLIGLGSVVGAAGAIVNLVVLRVNVADAVLVVALLAIAASVFLAASLPAMAHTRLATFVVALIGFGVGLDRVVFGFAGVGALLLFLGTGAAAIGAVLLELGRDEPLGGGRA